MQTEAPIEVKLDEVQQGVKFWSTGSLMAPAYCVKCSTARTVGECKVKMTETLNKQIEEYVLSSQPGQWYKLGAIDVKHEGEKLEDSMTLAQVGIEDGSSLTLSVETSQGDCQSPCCCCETGRSFCIPSGAYYSSGCCSPGSVSFKGASIAVSQAAEGAPVHTMER